MHPAELGRVLEERGFTSLWIGEHSHIPAVAHARPTRPAASCPAAYRRMMDPFLSLLAAAHATTTLRVGTGVALPLEHDLFALAKSVATLDRLSGGRFDFGVGVGWNVEQLADHRPDIPWASALPGARGVRRRAARRSGATTRPSTTAAGSTSTPCGPSPKPLQAPHPPIVGGMAGRLGTSHAVAWADAWMPMDLALGNVAKRVDRFRAGGGRGRPPADARSS